MPTSQMNSTIPLHIVYCKTRTLLTKRHYKDWREIQDAFNDYMASLGPWPATEVIDFFRDDFGEESRWPFSKARIEAFIDSDDETIATS